MSRNIKRQERARTTSPVVNPFPVCGPDVEVAEPLGIERNNEKKKGNGEKIRP